MRFSLGGGKALVNALYRTAENLGIDIRYEAHVDHLERDETKLHKSVQQSRVWNRCSNPAPSLPHQVGFRPILIGWHVHGAQRPRIF